MWRARSITLAGGDSLLVASPVRPDSAFIDGMLRAAWWEDSVRLAIASHGPHGVDELGHAAVRGCSAQRAAGARVRNLSFDTALE